MPRYTREEEKRRTRYENAKARVAAEEEAQAAEQGTPGDPTIVARRIEDVEVNDNQPVLITCRVSNENQRSHLEGQENALLESAIKHNVNVVGIIHHVGKADNPKWIKTLAKHAKRHGVKRIYMTDLTRLCRHPTAHKNRSNYHWRPRQQDLEAVKKELGDIEIITMLPPNATHEEILSSQVNRGKKHRKGGRPRNKSKGYKKQQRVDHINSAHQLRAEGMTSRQIATKVSGMSGFPVSHNTVARWLRTALVPA